MKIWSKKGHEDIDDFIEKFEVGKDYIYDSILAKYDVKATIAHVKGLNRIGLISDEDLVKILAELEYLFDSFSKNLPNLSYKDEDIHSYIENYLSNRLGEIAKNIHLGRSRNDQSLTMIRLFEKEQIESIISKIDELHKVLYRISRDHFSKKTPFIGYTHSRQAMPITFSFYIDSIISALEDNRKFLKFVYIFIDRNVLGSAAGYGVPLDLDREFTTKELGFSDYIENTLYAQNTRGKYEGMFLDALSYLIGDISRVATDLIFFSSDELGFVNLGTSITTGSSIMPHKKNPDVLELIRAKAKKLLSYSQAIKDITFSIPSGYSRDLQEIKELVVDGVKEVLDSLEALKIVFENIEVNIEKVFEKMSKKIFSLDIAIEIFKTEGIPFRDAYREVGAIFNEIDNENLNTIYKKYYSDDVKRKILDYISKDIKELYYEFIGKRKLKGYPKF